jgi:hypothetical protein
MTCPTGKIAYLFQEDAAAVVARMRDQSESGRGAPVRRPASLRPYRCPACGAWHVGHGLRRTRGRRGAA